MAETNPQPDTKTAAPKEAGTKAPAAKTSGKAAAKPGGRKKKVKAPSEQGRAYVQATFNNTIVSFTDATGKVLTWGSPGTAGFKGTRKSTPYAATLATQKAAEQAKQAGLRTVSVFVRGVGSGRDAAIRAIQSSGLNVTQLKDMTPIPHNGVRAKKPRRV
ncbi:MAG: 30S ribosomal protein S11 [Patescibacteria group bacterium]|nr:30S ribosomal protein S11 [Patescibacteria group bacterium]